MAKPIIEGIRSNEYDGGRIDTFFFSKRIDIHTELESLLFDLGFSYEDAEDFDFITTEQDGSFFIYKDEIRVHLVLSENEMFLILDTNIPKEKILKKVEEHFQIF